MNDKPLALRVFVRVAHTGSFSAAGRELDLSQPSVSRTIAALESEVGEALVIGFASVSACDEQPSVIYVADADATQLLQLTDAQGECAWPRRICYLTAWNGGTVSGCWSREHRHVRASFPDQEDKLVAGGSPHPHRRRWRVLGEEVDGAENAADREDSTSSRTEGT